MNSVDLRNPMRVAEGLVIFVYFLIQTSCGQDPAFSETKFGSGQNYSDSSSGDVLGQFDADGNPIDAQASNSGGSSSDDGSGEGSGSASDGNGGSSGGGTNPNLPTDPVQIIEVCTVYERQTYQTVLNFPERQDCNWNQNGNGEKRNEYMQARESQTRSFGLPANAVLCELSLESTMNNLHYDDFLFFTMNDYVLIGSNSFFVNKFAKEGNLFVWDWAKIYGMPWQEQGPYCLAGSEHCEIPGHDMTGGVDVALDTGVLSELALKILKDEDVKFSLIATGDNDEEDCFHSELNLELSGEYIVVPD